MPEYVAFLGVLIKKLVESGWRIADSWYAVCSDSKKIGHYWDSVETLHAFEPTGSRCICGFCDLANTNKILTCNTEILPSTIATYYWLASAPFCAKSSDSPLARLECDNLRFRYFDWNNSVGWLVLEK